MAQSNDLDPKVAAVIIAVAIAVVAFGGWFMFLRQPPQKLPPGVTNPAKLTEDYYAGRYRPGVGYVNTPQSAPAPAEPGAAPR